MKKRVRLGIWLLVVGIVMTKVKMPVYAGNVTIYLPEEADKVFEEMRKRVEEKAGKKFKDNKSGQSSTSNSDNSQTKKEIKQAPKCNHNYVPEVVKEADCANEGELKYTCSKCNDSYKEAIPVTDEHLYEDKITKEASCIETGVVTYTCKVCGDSYNEDIPVIEHDYSTEISVHPGCLTEGEEKTICSLCGDTITTVLPANGHTEGEWKVTKANGWFSAGEKTRYCESCGDILAVDVIEATYNIMYLYIGIGVLAVIILFTVILVVKRKCR